MRSINRFAGAIATTILMLGAWPALASDTPADGARATMDWTDACPDLGAGAGASIVLNHVAEARRRGLTVYWPFAQPNV